MYDTNLIKIKKYYCCWNITAKGILWGFSKTTSTQYTAQNIRQNRRIYYTKKTNTAEEPTSQPRRNTIHRAVQLKSVSLDTRQVWSISTILLSRLNDSLGFRNHYNTHNALAEHVQLCWHSKIRSDSPMSNSQRNSIDSQTPMQETYRVIIYFGTTFFKPRFFST